MPLTAPPEYIDAVKKVDWSIALPDVTVSERISAVAGPAWASRSKSVAHELEAPDDQANPLGEKIAQALIANVDALRHLDGLKIRCGAQNVTAPPGEKSTNGSTKAPLSHTYAYSVAERFYVGFDVLLKQHAIAWEEARRAWVDEAAEGARDFLIAIIAHGLHAVSVEGGKTRKAPQSSLDPLGFISDFGPFNEATHATLAACRTALERGAAVGETAEQGVEEAVAV